MKDDDNLACSAQMQLIIGEDLSLLSVDELERRIQQLRIEIVRLENAAAAKQTSRSVADALFKK